MTRNGWKGNHQNSMLKYPLRNSSGIASMVIVILVLFECGDKHSHEENLMMLPMVHKIDHQ